MKWYEYYKNYCKEFLIALGIKEAHLRLREHDKEELSHYSTGTSDIEYLFSFGWGEIWGIADRTDFDLRCHQETSKQNLEYRDPLTNESFLPYCIEPSVGVERLFLAFLCDAYEEEQLEGYTYRPASASGAGTGKSSGAAVIETALRESDGSISFDQRHRQL